MFFVNVLFSGKIKELLKPGMVNTMTRLALVNAIYFKGNWLNRFDPANTKEMPFKVNQVTLGKAGLEPRGPPGVLKGFLFLPSERDQTGPDDVPDEEAALQLRPRPGAADPGAAVRRQRAQHVRPTARGAIGRLRPAAQGTEKLKI